MSKPRLLLDLFCGAGGAAVGYHRAGFEVVGVDINPQPHYPFEFVQADALEALTDLSHYFTRPFDAIHASPPCQLWTRARKLQGRRHPDLITPLRPVLKASRLPYVIENVPGAPLIDPVLLCGSDFNLGVYRHRIFETSFYMPFSLHHPHHLRQTKMGRPPKPGEIAQIVGHFSGVVWGARAMGIGWRMTQGELAEAIPPAFTEFIGGQLIRAVERAA